MFVCRLWSVFFKVVDFVKGGSGDWVYRLVLFSLLVSFLSLRLPCLYGMSGFALFIIWSILPLFLGLLGSRLIDGRWSDFFCGFIPEGTPWWIAPFVCLAETLSYIVRPVVLMIRPFVNLSIGAMGGYVLGALCFSQWWVVGFLVLLFFYEVFVAAVHWFIVSSILSFSEDH